jgi:hypothetical protein
LASRAKARTSSSSCCSLWPSPTASPCARTQGAAAAAYSERWAGER